MTFKGFKERHLHVYPNSDLDNSQIADYYYIKFIKGRNFSFNFRIMGHTFALREKPEEIKELLNNISEFQTPIYSSDLPPILGLNKKVETFLEYYPNSKLTKKILIPVFQILMFRRNKIKLLEDFYKKFHPTKFLKYEDNLRKKYESNLRKKMPFLKMYERQPIIHDEIDQQEKEYERLKKIK